jgi:hypothetical protein
VANGEPQLPFTASVTNLSNKGKVIITFSRPLINVSDMPVIDEEVISMKIVSDNVGY